VGILFDYDCSIDILYYRRYALRFVKLRSHRHECEYESESGFRLWVVSHSYKLTRTSFARTSGAFTVTCTST